MRYDKLIIDDRVYKYNTVRQSVECVGKARTRASSQDLRLGVQHGNNKGLDNHLHVIMRQPDWTKQMLTATMKSRLRVEQNRSEVKARG